MDKNGPRSCERDFEAIAFKETKGHIENILTPVKLSGVVVPWSKTLGGGRVSEFKLIGASGLEYYFIADSEWKDILSQNCWNEVKVIALLNIKQMTLIPQKIFPKGPKNGMENVVDLAKWKTQILLKKIANHLDENAAIPVAI